MDRRSALTVLAASGAAMLLPVVASAEILERKKVLIHVPISVGEDREAALESAQKTIETALIGLLGWGNVVGLDLEEDIEPELRHDIKVDFINHSLSRPWLGKPSAMHITTEFIVQKRFHRDGKKLVTERLGGPHPGADFLETGRMSVFRRAMDLRIGQHTREVMEPLDGSKLEGVPFYKASTNEYLVQRKRQWMEQWMELRDTAFRELGGINVTVPIVFRRVRVD